MGKHTSLPAKLATLLGLSLLGATTTLADDLIHVSLWDKGAKAALVTKLAYDPAADLSHATMGVKLSKSKVKAGKITFEAKNDAKETIHEMLVIPLKAGVSPIISEKEARIAEETANALGEVPETDPGKTGTLTLDLTPGNYLITCNIPGHYMNGMWSVLTVE
jgi:uncharacterized cupredoxin-like copper-binding protein